MGNTPNMCCKRKSNIDIDIIDINNPDLKNNLSNIIILQSHIRKYLIRKKTNKLLLELPFRKSKIPGVIVDKSFLPKFEKINQKLQDIIANLEKMDLNDTKNLLRMNSDLKDFAIIYPDKTFYKGYLNKHWKKEGLGMLYLPDGSKYEGYFKNDEMDGKGRLVNSEGFYYEGEFKNNRANGYGKYANLDGTSYIGFWKDDKQNGYGEEFFSDGSKYEGNYIDGKKTGKGKFIWPGNSFFEGEFDNNDLQGFGEYHWRDGRVYYGEWKKNKMEGIGLFIWPDNKKYIGSYRNDKKNGYGIFTWPDGKCFEGEWAEGKQNGYGIFKSKEGIKYGEWKNGKKKHWIDMYNNEVEFKHVEKTLKEKKIEFEFEKAELSFKKEFDIIKKNFNKDSLIEYNCDINYKETPIIKKNHRGNYVNKDLRTNEDKINKLNNDESIEKNNIQETRAKKDSSKILKNQNIF